jgi:hypothetical protein
MVAPGRRQAPASPHHPRGFSLGGELRCPCTALGLKEPNYQAPGRAWSCTYRLSTAGGRRFRTRKPGSVGYHATTQHQVDPGASKQCTGIHFIYTSPPLTAKYLLGNRVSSCDKSFK